jgi:hypothetical protein
MASNEAVGSGQAMLWDLAEAARALRVSKSLLWQKSRAGAVPCVRIGRRLLFDPVDLRRLIDANKRGAAAPGGTGADPDNAGSPA